MKKFAILAFAAVMFVGLAACEKKGNEGEENGGTTNTETTNTATNTNATGEVANANTGETAPEMPLTTISFFEDSHNFGEIPAGDKVEHVFKFKNTGENPLKLESVKASCGCTTPEWTQEEVGPGEEGFVKAVFDSKGKSGVQNKSITIVANTQPKTKILKFTGEVVDASK